jgi:hypothetical protein
MFNTAGVLERSFTPVEEGYLYYPSRWSHGYLVKPEEYETLIDEWQRFAGWKGIWKLVGAMIVALIISMAIIYWLGLGERANTFLNLALAAAMAGYMIWKSTAANRLVRGREKFAPPRSSQAAEDAMGKALGRPMSVWLVVVSLSFLALAIDFAVATPLWGVPAVIIVATLAYFNLRIAIRAFRSKP